MNKVEISSGAPRHLLHPKMIFLVTSVDEDGEANIITVAWAIPTSFDPPLVAISIGETRYSHDSISDEGEFVINVPSKDLLEEAKFCGSRSGTAVDKFEAAGLTRAESEKVDVPNIEECVAHLECKVVDEFRTGDHTIFVGRIESAKAEEEVFDPDFKSYRMDKFEPILHVGGSEFLSARKKID